MSTVSFIDGSVIAEGARQEGHRQANLAFAANRQAIEAKHADEYTAAKTAFDDLKKVPVPQDEDAAKAHYKAMGEASAAFAKASEPVNLKSAYDALDVAILAADQAYHDELDELRDAHEITG